MLKFDPQNRVKEVEQGIYCVSVGAQTNCAGIACILGSIDSEPDSTKHDLGIDSLGNVSSESKFYGADIPERYREAVLSGVLEEIENLRITKSVKFRLIGILYHPVDSNINMHKISGRVLVRKWCESNA